MKRNASAATGALAANAAEAQQRALAEAVDDLERGQLLAAKPTRTDWNGAVLGLRRRLRPLEAVLRRAASASVEVLVERAAGEQRRRRRAERLRRCVRELTWFRSAS